MSYEIVKIPKVRITAQLGDKAGQIKRALGARLDGFRCGQHLAERASHRESKVHRFR